MNIAVINLLRIGDVFQTVPLLLWLKNFLDHNRNTENNRLVLISDHLDIDILKKESIVDDIVKVNYRKILSVIGSRINSDVTNKEQISISSFFSFSKDLSDLPFNNFDKVFNLGTNHIGSIIAEYILSSDKKGSEIIGPLYDKKRSHLKNNLLTENNLSLNRQFKYLFEISSYKDLSVVNLAEIYLSFLVDSNLLEANKHNLELFSKNYNDISIKNNNFHGFEISNKRTNDNETIVINISTGDVIREFDVYFYSQLIVSLIDDGYSIVIVGVLPNLKTDMALKKDEKILNNLTSEQKKSVLNLCNKTDISSLLDLFNSYELFITPDTGTIHLAASLSNINILGLYNVSAYHRLTGAYSDRAYFLTPNINCYPCEENYQVCRERGNKLGVEILECKKYFSVLNIVKSVNYILRDKSIDQLDNLTLSKSINDSKLCNINVIQGEKDSSERKIYSIMIKELLFRINFDISLTDLIELNDNSIYLSELVKIYTCSKQEDDYTDFINFIRNNKRTKNLDFLLQLI